MYYVALRDSSLSSTQDTGVWLKDLEYVWVPAKVLSPPEDGFLVVEREDKPGQEIKLPFSDPPPIQNPDILVGQNDLTTLSYLHEPAGQSCPSFRLASYYRVMSLLLFYPSS